MITVINATAAVTLLEQRPEKNYDRSHVALIAQLGEHCTSIAEVVGSNPAQSLKFFSGLCSSSVTAAVALITVITQLLLMDN